MKKNLLTEKGRTLVKDGIEISVDEIVEAIALSVPGINIAYRLSKSFYGASLKLRQQRALEWVEFIRDNLDKFSKSLFDQEEFQDCFVILLESYIKQRSEKKRTILQKLLLDSTTEVNLEEFDLERINACLTQISTQALKVIAFIKERALPEIEAEIQEELKVFNYETPEELKRLTDGIRARKLVSEKISLWVTQNYSPNGVVLKGKYDLDKLTQREREVISYREHLKRKELTDPLPELATLGILVFNPGTELIGGNVGRGYGLTEFGYKFMEFI